MKSALIATISAIAMSGLLAAKAQAHPQWGIAVDRQGQVYFSELEAIWKIDAQSRAAVFRAGVSGRHTHDLSIDDAGNLYGEDISYVPATQKFISAVWKMTPAGGFSYLIEPTDDPPEGASVTRDREGNTYHIAYHPERELLVLKRTPKGDVTVLVGSSTAARNYRQGVMDGRTAFGSDSALYFIHGPNVSKVTMSGTLTALARDLKGESASDNRATGSSPAQLFGIAVDAQNNVFVADYSNRRVSKISPDKRITTAIRAEGDWIATGVAHSGNDLYILENKYTPAHAQDGTRVRKMSPDGKVTVLATIGQSKASTDNRTADESPSAGNSERVVDAAQNVPFALIGAAAGVFALTVIIWRVRNGRLDRPRARFGGSEEPNRYRYRF